MPRTMVRLAAALAIPATMLLGAATGNAAGLSHAIPLERAIAASEIRPIIKIEMGTLERKAEERKAERRNRHGGKTRHRSRHHRRHYGYSNGIYFGFYAPLPSYRSRSYSSTCRYWSRRCTANWGYGNSNYYGCMRYEGC